MAKIDKSNMKRPSFQFYPGDWQSNLKLKRCSFHLKGIWLEVMFLFHDSDEYGMLRWALDEIALAIGCGKEDLEKLVDYKILKGTDKNLEKVSFSSTFLKRNAPPSIETLIDSTGPLWYSSRMVRDEYIRQKRMAGGYKSLENQNVPRRKGENDKIDKDINKDTLFPSPSSSSSPSNKKHIVEHDKKPSSSTACKPKIPYKKIIDYLNLKTGKGYKHDTKATIGLIKARWNEGFTLDDFKKVIDIKTPQWINDPEFNKNLAPKTLFKGGYFDAYLNENFKTGNSDIARQEEFNKIEEEIKKDNERNKSLLKQ